ncbi:ABC transporter substrate-binding protein [Pseudonocardia spinosispora]|uniref:ABC transporter substrate-binding protein n=1 Tax=Pseudonocardia spinosispora TaxID=103441 RepID=UPI000424B062|nr:ABC transporter substrate-binding protein [Pseudonocardia spinosispora]
MRPAWFISVVALAAVLAACSSATERPGTGVPPSPKRIVVLSGGMTGDLFALGATVVATDTRVLGVTNDEHGFPPQWSAAATAQGTVGLPGVDELSTEAVAAARPDLILGGGQGITGVQAEANYDKLARIAPTVLIPRTVTSWQEQLRLLAEAIGRADRVPALLRAYDDKLASVRAAVNPPPGPFAVILSISGSQPCLVPADAQLPELLRRLGFTPDDVWRKAGNPPKYGTGDSFTMSPELLSQAADAPTAFVIRLTGRTVAELAADPLYARLPAFRDHQVTELPASSYRLDYDGALRTLDLIGGTFR